MTDLLEKKPAVEKIERPAKAWVNWWLLTARIQFNNGAVHGPGELASRYIWPSKDVAEMKANWWLANGRAIEVKREHCHYIGAFPVSE